jgi:hypothetical protein
MLVTGSRLHVGDEVLSKNNLKLIHNCILKNQKKYLTGSRANEGSETPKALHPEPSVFFIFSLLDA